MIFALIVAKLAATIVALAIAANMLLALGELGHTGAE